METAKDTSVTELKKQIELAISQYRMTFGNEEELQVELAEIFTQAGIVFEREFKLSPADRPDFWIEPFAIEVKVSGSFDSHLRQVQRYNRHEEVSGTILIGTKPWANRMPETLAGKPSAYINIGRNRL